MERQKDRQTAMNQQVAGNKAVVYYRVSSPRQGERGYGLDAQRTAIANFLMHHNYDVEREFTEVESAGNNKRAILQKALNYCLRHKTTLLIAKLDRLSRRVSMISELLESNVHFRVVEFPTIDPKKDPFFFHVLAATGELELKHIRERTKAGLAEARRKGVKLGEHGKILARKNKREANDFAVSLRSTIKDLNNEGFFSVRDIADELNRRKVPTFRNAQWHPTTVHSLMNRLKSNR